MWYYVLLSSFFVLVRIRIRIRYRYTYSVGPFLHSLGPGIIKKKTAAGLVSLQCCRWMVDASGSYRSRNVF